MRPNRASPLQARPSTRSLGVEMDALPLTPTKAFWMSCVVVGSCAVALPFISGYGTTLFQAVALGAWGLVAALSSDLFADTHKAVVWFTAAILNVLFFAVPAVGVLLATRTRWPVASTWVLILWLLFYVASLFVLFPATDGP